MKRPLKPFLEDYGVVILDGAMATELEGRGAVLEDSLWSAKVLLESPELIREVHYDYFAAGAGRGHHGELPGDLPGPGATRSLASWGIGTSYGFAHNWPGRRLMRSGRSRHIVTGVSAH